MVATGDKLSAQVAVLGSLLIEPRLTGEALARVRAEDFTTPRYRMVFQAIRAQFVSGEPVDPVTVRARLGVQPGDGWDQLLLELMEVTPTAANIWEYTALLREEARMSRVAELAAALQAAPDTETARECLAQFNELMVDRRGVKRMDMEELLLDFSQRHTEAHQYMTWGLPKVDAGVSVDPGDYVVLGGYPSAGKTSLGVSFAYHQAAERRVGFYSLETSRYKLADRLIANLADIDLGSIRRGKIDDGQWARLAQKSDRIRARQLELIEASGMSVADIQADTLARRYEVVYVDYLQLIEPESRRMNRTEQVSGISRGLQRLAHEQGRLVVALSQLTRAEREGKAKDKVVEPTMSDLRESGQIEQDADCIMLLYLDEPNRPDVSRRVLKVAKNKEGTRGRMYLTFDGDYQRFRESALDQPAPRPAAREKPAQMSFTDLPEDTPVPF